MLGLPRGRFSLLLVHDSKGLCPYPPLGFAQTHKGFALDPVGLSSSRCYAAPFGKCPSLSSSHFAVQNAPHPSRIGSASPSLRSGRLGSVQDFRCLFLLKRKKSCTRLLGQLLMASLIFRLPHSLLATNRQGVSMRIKPLHTSKHLHIGQAVLRSLLAHPHNTRAALELVSANPRKGFT